LRDAMILPTCWLGNVLAAAAVALPPEMDEINDEIVTVLDVKLLHGESYRIKGRSIPKLGRHGRKSCGSGLS